MKMFVLLATLVASIAADPIMPPLPAGARNGDMVMPPLPAAARNGDTLMPPLPAAARNAEPTCDDVYAFFETAVGCLNEFNIGTAAGRNDCDWVRDTLLNVLNANGGGEAAAGRNAGAICQKVEDCYAANSGICEKAGRCINDYDCDDLIDAVSGIAQG